jgi:hypothetical protein
VVIDAAEAQKAGLTPEKCKEVIETSFRTQHHWLENHMNETKAKMKEVSPGLEGRLEVIGTMYEITGECPSCNQELLSQVSDAF